MSPVAKSVEAPASNRFESFGSKNFLQNWNAVYLAVWPWVWICGTLSFCLSRSVPWFALAFLRKGAAVHRQWQLPSSRTHFMDHTNCLCNGMTVWLYVWPSQSRRKKLECLKSLLFEVRCEAVGAGYDQVPIHLGYFQQHFGVYGTGIWPWLTHSRTAIQYSSLQALAGDWNVDLQRFVQVFHWWVSFLDIDFMYFMSLARLWGSYHSEALMQQLAASACETWHLRDPKPQWLSDLDVSWCILIHGDPWPTWLWGEQAGVTHHSAAGTCQNNRHSTVVLDLVLWCFVWVAFSLRLLQGYPDSPSSLLQTEGTYVSNCASVSSAVGCLWDVDWSVSAMHSARMKHTLRHLLHGDRESFCLTLFSLSYHRFHVSYIYIHIYIDGWMDGWIDR